MVVQLPNAKGPKVSLGWNRCKFLLLLLLLVRLAGIGYLCCTQSVAGHVAQSVAKLTISVLQVVDFPDATGPKVFSYDTEWLAILRRTHSAMNLYARPAVLPGGSPSQYS